MRIKVAQQLVREGAPLTAADGRAHEATGIFIPWIEIDGHRITDLRTVDISMGAKSTSVVVDFMASAEIVFVDKEGAELAIVDEPADG